MAYSETQKKGIKILSKRKTHTGFTPFKWKQLKRQDDFLRQYCIYHLVFKGIIAKADGTGGRYVQNMATLELKTKQKNILSKKKKKKRLCHRCSCPGFEYRPGHPVPLPLSFTIMKNIVHTARPNCKFKNVQESIWWRYPDPTDIVIAVFHYSHPLLTKPWIEKNNRWWKWSLVAALLLTDWNWQKRVRHMVHFRDSFSAQSSKIMLNIDLCSPLPLPSYKHGLEPELECKFTLK